MVGERIKVIPRNIKSDYQDVRNMKVLDSVKSVARRFHGENKAAYQRTKYVVKRGYERVKSVARAGKRKVEVTIR